MTKWLKRLVAVSVLSVVYGFTVLWAAIFGKLVPQKGKRHQRIIINGTFHNPNWFHAHIAPICQSNYGQVVLICDEPLDDLTNLVYDCPPAWAQKVFSRAGAKFIWTLKAGIVTPADVFVGYHIFPSAVTALCAARLTGAKAMYQVTSGPLELEGGGWNAENAVLTALGKPSRIVERCALAVTNRFDSVIVRGSSAKDYILENGYRGSLEMVTGSVDCDSALMRAERDIDILFVGRLAEYKRPDRFIEVIKGLAVNCPDIQVSMAGDGPDREALEAQVVANSLQDRITFLGKRSDVPELMGRAKVFVLTSRWEGVSIAMLEAMALAVVPVVSDVGDMRDYALDGKTGYVIEPNDLGRYVDVLTKLLTDDAHRLELGERARNLILNSAERGVLSARWCRIMNSLVEDQV